MQSHQARWFHDRVMPWCSLQISKLMPWESPVRMDKRGDNLKWWNVDFDSPLGPPLTRNIERKS